MLLLAAAACLGVTASAQNAAKPARPDAEARKAHHAQMMAIYDENKDGVLDATEREVLKTDIKSGAAPRLGGGRGPGGRKGPPPELLATYDLDGDGTLDEDERAQVRADIVSGKLTPPAGGPRGRRGPPAGDPADAAKN